MLLGHLPACPCVEPGSHSGSKSEAAEIMVPTWDSFHHVIPSRTWREWGRSEGFLERRLFFLFMLHHNCSGCQT